MKIKSIKLRHFQSHDQTEITFSPGITTIKGSTDRGKSAIVRALQWVCLNALSGDGFIKDGEKRASVQIELADEKKKKIRKLVREKDKTGAVNTYSLDDETFKAFGQGVPDPVSEALQLNQTNFQSQHDSPFWFGDSAGEVSRKLNSVIDLGIIDDVLRDINSEVESNIQRVKVHTETLERTKIALSLSERDAKQITEFEKLEKLRGDAEAAWGGHKMLADLVDKVEESPAQKLKRQEAEASALFEIADDLMFKDRDCNDLMKLIERIKESQSIERPPDFKPLTSLREMKTEITRECNALKTLVDRYEEIEGVATNRKLDLIEMKRQFEKKTKGKRCPICQQEIQ